MQLSNSHRDVQPQPSTARVRRACATQGLKEKKLAQDNLDKVFAWRLTQGMGRAQGLKEKKLAQDNLDKVDKLAAH